MCLKQSEAGKNKNHKLKKEVTNLQAKEKNVFLALAAATKDEPLITFYHGKLIMYNTLPGLIPRQKNLQYGTLDTF